jgi:hypothetical protein
MRKLALLLLAVAACRPSASVERTTPVANLQIYRSVLIRVGGQAAADRATQFEQQVAAELRSRCSMEIHLASDAASAAPSDLELALTVQRAGRGGDGLIQNPNLATMDVLLVLSDKVDGELLGSALIRGKSSAMLVEGSISPEDQAVDVVAKTIGGILGKSGCSGTRLARPAAPTTADAGPEVATGEPGAPGDADAVNEAGKQKFKNGDPAGALAEFKRALELRRDPRFLMNMCLAHEALEQWEDAAATCNEVIRMKPPEALATKAKQRLAIIDEHQRG